MYVLYIYTVSMVTFTDEYRPNQYFPKGLNAVYKPIHSVNLYLGMYSILKFITVELVFLCGYK